jgi:VIT1/CCC1 family predicted Fe2+/Mn2+ transporter
MPQKGPYHTHHEPHDANTTSKLNWLRASVLGANDGIVSVAGIVVGVAGATDNPHIILTAGIAGIIAGAISMAAGEFVSVSSSRDTEKALLKKEKEELEQYPEEEFEELVHIYEDKGLSKKTARIVAEEFTAKDPYAAHVDVELNINPDDLTNPWHAAFASAASFLSGAVIPIAAIIFFPQPIKISMTFISVLIALAITGTISAKVGNASVLRATIRVVTGGALAMIVTYSVGKIFGVSGF